MQNDKQKILVEINVYNESIKIKDTLSKFPPHALYDVVVVDDGSTDDTPQYIKEFSYPVIRHAANLGIGKTIKDAIEYGQKNGYDIIVLMAGNGKMQAPDIPKLVLPILEEGYDYIQGSRYLEGGRNENLPLFRDIMIKLLTLFVSSVTGFKGTDVTCGFRAYKLSILENPKINIWQDWLDRYELESYIHYKALTLGYRIKEVPVSMIYPKQKSGYSKIKPFSGWWSILKPWILLPLRIRK
jgi:dolichol-phosphate mannosyltransferase